MYEVIEYCKEIGIAIDTYKPAVSSNRLLWDSVNNIFCYLNDGTITYVSESGNDQNANCNFWVAVNDVNPDCEYSQYLVSNTLTGSITVKKAGFDAGTNTQLTEVIVNNNTTNTITVRTNGGNIKIYAPQADVYVSGTSNTLTVLEAAPSSVHIYNAVVKKLVMEDSDGHVEVESGATIMRLEAKAGDIDINAGSTISYLEVSGTTKVEVEETSSIVKYYTDNTTNVTGISTDKKMETAKQEEVAECTTHTEKTIETSGNRCVICSVCNAIISVERISGGNVVSKDSSGDNTGGNNDNPGGNNDNPGGNNDTPTINTYTITVTKNNVTADSNNPTSIKTNENKTLTFTADTGYVLPESVSITGATSSWNKSTGVLTISNPTSNVTITINGQEQGAYTITVTKSHVTADSNNATSIKDDEVELKFTADSDYKLPDSITVTGATYIWNENTGSLFLNNPTSNVTVTINGVKNYTEINLASGTNDEGFSIPTGGTNNNPKIYKIKSNSNKYLMTGSFNISSVSNVVLDLNGQTIVGDLSGTPDSFFNIVEANNITIKNGTIVTNYHRGIRIDSDASNVTLDCNVIVNAKLYFNNNGGLTNSNFNEVNNESTTFTAEAVLVKGTAKVIGGSYKANHNNDQICSIRNNSNNYDGCYSFSVDGGASLTITGGTISDAIVTTGQGKNEQGYSYTSYIATLTINGGDFGSGVTLFVGADNGNTTVGNTTYCKGANDQNVVTINGGAKLGSTTTPTVYTISGTGSNITASQVNN